MHSAIVHDKGSTLEDQVRNMESDWVTLAAANDIQRNEHDAVGLRFHLPGKLAILGQTDR